MPDSSPQFGLADELVFAHPAFFLAVPQEADTVHGLIVGLPSLQHLATVIGDQKEAGWVDKKTVTSGSLTATYRVPSAKTLEAAAPCFAELASRVIDSQDLKGVLWFDQTAVAPIYRTVSKPDDPEWVLEGVGVGYGIAITSLSNGDGFNMVVTNASARYIGLYARFVDADGKPVTVGDWHSRLPKTVDGRFETESCKFLALVPPMVPVAGVAPATTELKVDFPFPQNAAAVSLEFGTVGYGAWDAVTCGLGAMATALLAFTAPNVIAQANANLTDVYPAFIKDNGVVDDALSAAACLLDTATIGDALGVLAEKTPELVYGGHLKRYSDALATAAGSQAAMFAAADQVAWAAALLGVSAAGDYLHVPISAPCRFVVPIGPNMVGNAQVVLVADSGIGVVPPGSEQIAITTKQAGRTRQFPVGADVGLTPMGPISVYGVSAGDPVEFSVSVLDSGGRELVSGTGAGIGNGVTPPTVPVRLTQWLPPLGEVTCFATIDTGPNGSFWMMSSVAPTATIADLSKDNQGDHMARIASLAMSADGRFIAYSWEASGQKIPVRGSTQPTDDQIYSFQCLSMPPAFPMSHTIADWGSHQPIIVAFDPYDPSAAYYVEQTAGGPARIRPFVPGEPVPDALVSCGAFPLPSVQDVVLLPTGQAVAISTEHGLLATVALSAAVPDGQDTVGTVTGGFGRPVAVTATHDGTVLVLDAHAARIRAVNAYGVPVPAFPKAATALHLDVLGSGRTWLDLTVDPDGNLFLVSFAGDGKTADQYRLDILSPEGQSLWTTGSFAAGRLAVSPTRTVAALNYLHFTACNNHRTNPMVSLWSPGIGS